MSHTYLAVEKVTESQLGIVIMKLSLGLAANDKRREGVARSVGPLLTYLPDCPSGTRPLLFIPCRGLLLILKHYPRNQGN